MISVVTRGLLIFSFVIASPVFAMQTGNSPATKQRATQKQNKNVESFELVWNTIRDTHWDETLVGESWERHRQELLPKIKAASSIGEAREVMSDLIGRLGQSHFGIIPSDSYDVIGEDADGGGNCDIGLTVRIVENGLVVTGVRPGSSAARAGVGPGWEIKKIRDRDADDLIQKFGQAADGPQRTETIAGLAMNRMTSGSMNEKIEIDFEDSNNHTPTLVLAFEETPGTIAILGNLPPMRVTDETRTLDGNIGYYKFNAFLDPVKIMPAYRKAVRDKAHSNGLIIDLRGNVGGLAGMTMGMAGEFVTEKKQLGTMSMKGTELKFFANPRSKPVTVPVALVVDECSISSAEIFAGGLQDLGLARVFGSRTAGLALPSIVIKLPNGDGFQYAFADYHSANGQTLEINGVVPDETINLTRQELTAFGDPALNAAIHWIEQKNND